MRKLKKYEVAATSKSIVKLFPEKSAVTELITPQGIATKIKGAWLDAYKLAGVALDSEQLEQIKEALSRQHIRRLLQELEENGITGRARVNCQPQKLAGLSFDEAMAQGLITPIVTLSEREKKRLGGPSGGRLGIFLRAKPKATKGLRLNVAINGYIKGSNSNDSNIEKQFLFTFMRQNDMRKLLAQAAKLAPREDIQAAMKAHHELVTAVNSAFKEYLLRAFASSEPLPGRLEVIPPPQQTSLFAGQPNEGSPAPHPALVPPSAAVIPNATAASSAPPPRPAADPPFVASPEDVRIPDAEFKQAVIAAFVDEGRAHPTPSQVRKVVDSLPDHACARQAFLDSLKKSMPRIQSPGVLDSHTRGFVAAWPALLDKLEADRAAERRQAVARTIENAPLPPEDLTGEWGTVKASLRNRVTPDGYDNWLRGTRQLTRAGASLYPLIEVPDQETLAWLTTEYAAFIARAFEDAGLVAPRYEVKSKTRTEVA